MVRFGLQHPFLNGNMAWRQIQAAQVVIVFMAQSYQLAGSHNVYSPCVQCHWPETATTQSTFLILNVLRNSKQLCQAC